MRKHPSLLRIGAIILVLFGLMAIYPHIGIILFDLANLRSPHPATQPVPLPAKSAVVSETPIPSPHPFAVPGEIALQAVSPAPLAHPEDRSPLADQLNAPDRTIGQDMSVVLDLFEHYRGMYGGLPTGEDNAQVINALSGNNPRRLAFIERSNPAVNAKGELTDRWGTPFFFHFISHDSLEIRSAGPDRQFYTPDDTVKGR